MNDSVAHNGGPLRLVVVNTPIGALGSGEGGGVELTLRSLIQGLVLRGHHITLVAARGSTLPAGCEAVELVEVEGVNQPSWQHAAEDAAVVMPRHGLLQALWEAALDLGEQADAVINGGYDWLPLWLTPRVKPRLFHLVSMGDVASVMREVIEAVGAWNPKRLAFHTLRQASDFALPLPPTVVGNGFDLANYTLQLGTSGPLGWAGRIAPEKGLEDAAAAAAALGERLLVWGLREDDAYAKNVEAGVPPGTIDWRGFRATADLQRELGACRALINTPKWNEAYGNVVIEALACGVPVVAYDRGGPGELVQNGETGWLVPADDVSALTDALQQVADLDRQRCRSWVEQNASRSVFSERVEAWILAGLEMDASINSTR